MDIPLDRPKQLTSIEDVYRAHGDRLWRSLLGYTGDSAIAEDAMAEAFAQALRRGPALHDPEAWVWRAAFRIAAGALKDRRRRLPASAEPTYELAEVPGDLADALAQLPDGQRAAIVLTYYADLPAPDVAQALGTTSAAVRVSLMRARRRLRTLLEIDHE